MKREYKLAADPIKPGGPLTYRREILDVTDGRRDVILVVQNADAIDVLEALRRAYQDGREDHADEYPRGFNRNEIEALPSEDLFATRERGRAAEAANDLYTVLRDGEEMDRDTIHSLTAEVTRRVNDYYTRIFRSPLAAADDSTGEAQQ